MKETEERKKMKEQSAITLIALVITIIVLLILAAVSIATLTGENGILTKASKSKEETKYNQALEEVQLAVTSARVDYEVKNKKFEITEEYANDIQEELNKTSEDGLVYVDGAFMYAENRGYLFEIDEEMKVSKSEIEVVNGEAGLWEQENGVIIAYKGDISQLDGKTLVIPNYVDGVRIKEIGSGLFSSKIQSPMQVNLEISNGIKVIGSGAFSSCTGLTGNLVIPNSIITIATAAFYECTGFTGDLTIPNSVTAIETTAFANCTGFTGNLIIGNNVTTIGSGAFASCAGLTGNLVIPNSVTVISNGAFSSCTGLTGDLIIPDSVKTIDGGAFAGCSGFTGNLIIGNNVTTIGSEAFASCSGFTKNLTIGNNVTTIGSSAFSNCRGFTGKLTVGMKEIPANFMESYLSEANFTELEITDKTITIGSSAFEGADSIITVRISASVENMGSKAMAIGVSGVSKLIYVEGYLSRPDSWSYDWINYYYDPTKNSGYYRFPYVSKSSSGFQFYYNCYYFEPSAATSAFSYERNQIAVIWGNSSTLWYQPIYGNGKWY